MKNLLYFLSFFLLAITACDYKKGLLPVKNQSPSPGACDSISFSKQIMPILNANCTSCHVPSYMYGDFTTYTSTMVKVNDNTFVDRVITKHNMPAPTGLLQADIDKIKCWVDKGFPNN